MNFDHESGFNTKSWIKRHTSTWILYGIFESFMGKGSNPTRIFTPTHIRDECVKVLFIYFIKDTKRITVQIVHYILEPSHFTGQRIFYLNKRREIEIRRLVEFV